MKFYGNLENVYRDDMNWKIRKKSKWKMGHFVKNYIQSGKDDACSWHCGDKVLKTVMRFMEEPPLI